jgi:hypothetical protein
MQDTEVIFKMEGSNALPLNGQDVGMPSCSTDLLEDLGF